MRHCASEAYKEKAEYLCMRNIHKSPNASGTGSEQTSPYLGSAVRSRLGFHKFFKLCSLSQTVSLCAERVHVCLPLNLACRR